MQRRCIVAGNWKLNGSAALCRRFVAELSVQNKRPEVVICPPATYIAGLAALIAEHGSAIKVGGQNVAEQSGGAYTGEISAQMLAEAGANYCIVGHSERRAMFGETDVVIARKAQQLLAESVTPIICVGEDLATREAGDALPFVSQQLSSIFSELGGDTNSDLSQVIVAYEPVWAIGTGKVASEAQVQEMHENIRDTLGRFGDASSVSLLYGGSVNADNAKALFALSDVDGALVGGASLEVGKFEGIVNL